MKALSVSLDKVLNPSSEKFSLPCDPSTDAHTANLVKRYQALVVFRPDNGDPVEAAAVPTEVEKLALLGRYDAIQNTLQAASTNERDMARVGLAVSDMLGGGYSSLQNVDRKASIASYTEALQDLPAWACERGCEAVRHGKVEGLNPDWPPTQARLHQIAEQHLAPAKHEQSEIVKVLLLRLPPVVDEEERERVKAAAKAWLDRTDPKAKSLVEAYTEVRKRSFAPYTADDLRALYPKPESEEAAA